MNNNIEIVTTRCNENLEWLNDEPFNKYPVTIYNKGTNENFINSSNIVKVVNLPNKGCDVHSIIYHIINNYDNLSNITAFFQGSINYKQLKYNRACQVVNESVNRNTSIFSCYRCDNYMNTWYDFQMDSHVFSSENNRTENNDKTYHCTIRPYGKWFDELFNIWHNKDSVNLDHFNNLCYNDIFSLKKEHILRKPKEYYEYLLSFVEEGVQPEAVHYFERAWTLIFSPLNDENFVWV